MRGCLLILNLFEIRIGFQRSFVLLRLDIWRNFFGLVLCAYGAQINVKFSSPFYFSVGFHPESRRNEVRVGCFRKEWVPYSKEVAP